MGCVATIALVGPKITAPSAAPTEPQPPKLSYKSRRAIDTSGFGDVVSNIPPWPATASLERIASSWRGAGHHLIEKLGARLSRDQPSAIALVVIHLEKAGLLNYEGEPDRAYAVLEECRCIR
jgi:hypothetical protein